MISDMENKEELMQLFASNIESGLNVSFGKIAGVWNVVIYHKHIGRVEGFNANPYIALRQANDELDKEMGGM